MQSRTILNFTKRNHRLWLFHLSQFYSWGCYDRYQHVLAKPTEPIPAKTYAAAVRASYAAFQDSR